MVGWHHRLNGYEFEHAPRDSEGQGSLECCSPRDCRDGHDSATEQQQENERLTSIWIVKMSHNSGALNLRAVVSSSLESRYLRSCELRWNFHNHAVWNLSLLPPGNLSPRLPAGAPCPPSVVPATNHSNGVKAGWRVRCPLYPRWEDSTCGRHAQTTGSPQPHTELGRV